MASASQREISFDWYWESNESIRAGRAMRAVCEVPRWLVWAAWILAAAIFAVAPLLIAGAPAGERGTLASSLLPVLFVCAYVLFKIYVMRTDRARPFWEMPARFNENPLALAEMPGAEHPITITISDGGYTTAFRNGSRGHAWTRFRGVRETDEFILLLFQSRGGYYFPKRAVPADDLESIRDILREHFGQEARLMDAPAPGPHPRRAALPA